MMVKVPSKSPLLLGKKLEWQKEKINKNRNITAKRIESEDKWPSPGSFFSINLKMLDHSPSLLTSSNSNLSETVKDILPNSLISPCEPVSNLTFTNKEKHLQSKDDLKETRKRLIYSPLKGTPPKRLRVENEAVDLESSFRFDNTMRNYLRPFDSSTPNQPKKKPSSPTSSTFDHHNNDTDIDFKRVANQKEVSTHMEYAKNNKSIMNSILKANEKEVLTPKKSAKNNKSKLNSSISKSGDNKRTSKPYRRKRKLCMPNRRRSEKACQTSKLNKTKNTNELETNKNQTKTESDYALNNESEVVKNASKTKSKKIHILSERSNIQSENTKSNHLSGLELKNLTRTERDYAIDKQIIENMATDSDESEDVNCSSKLKKKKSKNILPKKSLPQNLLGPFIQNEDEQSSSKLPETVRVKMHGQNIMANLKLVLPVSEKWDKPSHNSTHVETIKHFSFLHFCYGQLKIKAFGEKGLQKSKCSAIMFFVLFGNLEVTIHETTFSVGPGVNFLVPQGNVYNIVNPNNMEARLIYMQVKDPKEIN